MSTGPSQGVCITGTGVVTALGFSVLSNYEPLSENVSAVRDLADGAAPPVLQKAARVSEPRVRCTVPSDQESQLKFLNPSGQLALGAVSEALGSLEAGGLDLGALDPARKSLYLAQVDSRDWDCHDFRDGFVAAGAVDDAPLDMPKLNRQASRRTKPFFLLESLKNNVYSFVASWLDLMGPNTSLAGTSHAGFQAFDMALRTVARGQVDTALVLGAAVLSDPVSRFELGKRMQEREDGEPVEPGDGAGALFLEPVAAVEARGGRMLGRVLACTAGMGAPDEGGPSDETLRAVVTAAVAESGREKIELVIVPRLAGHAHKTLLGNPVFAGGKAVAWRPLLGHLGAAMEPVEIAMALTFLQPGQAALLVSTGFYGQAGALVLARPTLGAVRGVA